MQPSPLHQIRGKKLALLSEAVATWTHCRAWQSLLMRVFENSLLPSHWGLEEAAPCATGSPDASGEGRGSASGWQPAVPLPGCASPWPPSWRRCPNLPEHDSSICPGDWQKRTLYCVGLAVASPRVGLCSLALLWDGLCGVPVTLLLAARIGGAVLNLQILPRDG